MTYKNPLALRYFAEVWRVLTPGGRHAIVETSQPESPMVRQLFHLYLRQVVSRLGLPFSGKRGAYRYLAESARHFYTSAEVSRMLLEAGFRQVGYRPLRQDANQPFYRFSNDEKGGDFFNFMLVAISSKFVQ